MFRKYLRRFEFQSYEDFKENYQVNVPENFHYAFDVVDAIASEAPEKTAMVWCNEAGDSAAFTFRQIQQYSNQAANFFKAVGITKGDRVMLILKRRYQYWFALLGLHKLGAVCIPATHLMSAKDIEYRNNAAEIKMIVCVADQELISSVEEAQKSSPSLALKALVGGSKAGWYDYDEETSKASDKFTRPTGKDATSNDDALLIYFTSGTTGLPKMVQHSYTYPLGHILTAKYWHNLQDGDLHFTVSDTGWAKTAWGKIYGQWLCGAAVFVYDYDKFMPKSMLKVMSQHGVTSLCAPPTIYRYLIKDLKRFDLSKLRHACVAGEPLNPEIYKRFYEATGLKLMEAYGQTELTVTIATFPWMEPKPGSMGKPSAGYDIDLLDEKGESCEKGQVGQIIVRTGVQKPVGLFDGYYRDEALTQKVFHDDIYYTGDLAWRDEDGYYWFVSRSDDIIKSAGYRIGPFEVESALLEHPAVLECAITPVPDPERGQIIKATVVLAKGYLPSESLKKELQEHVKRVTAAYKCPKIIEFVSSLPKTISGKIRRVEIREGGALKVK
ncbi:MAG: AMP-binding protein [Thermacetogeniaceae bacterium]